MRASTNGWLAASVAAALLLGSAAPASASPPRHSVTLPTGSTTPLPGTRVPTAKVDGWVSVLARGGIAAGGTTAFDANIELLFVEAMGIGYGFLAGEDGTSYLRLTYGMLDVKYWLWSGYVDILFDTDGVKLGTALSIPVIESNNLWLRLSLELLTDPGDTLFGAGLEVAIW